ncbi:MotA/TolQ/ExbB proton channel family protein [Pseudidiomarina terrestris]|uniref:MotA/TolQ/ExbB proton channel family protein n=1 Tax=Pseudidiomarina terrestris TaxID=2820060 RepID=A0AAW7R1Y8_9GAMM|nr:MULTISPECIES: MotA/TolQ/ExbB proton channel family protein [unclassified Pseudidiomarina]MDN7125133.1 MotA/TolQ/ExbB proton channel family protein [Pseudidiomarina sp. 1APP75-32.1]MDN7127464.1 MotA/TolQ/ExbB proton channel family protein [Pseudidiomarina sp. 1APR75-33.1]MDN7136060.1 MotA/TolQ/ExbB proton channel family protein [Pseudidiomarina sp. 1ASP75-5]MEA3589001.1 MotA/TolQ/ExbB proton channel family protein [Pseudidiomarina sp. 1APP75-27a]
MVFFIDFYNAIQDFVETGGQVLLIIGILIFIMWLMILERIFYFTRGHQQQKQQVLQKWKAREDKSSWNAEQIRQAMISRVSIALGGRLPVLQALVALCPLLGLMGTVTGMIEVFDVMAVAGTGNARSMAAGVSKATIPTMAGMVGALSGVFATTWLQRTAKRERLKLEDRMLMEHH